MRNHWINVSVDGRKNDLGAGPKAKSGEMKITLAQMNKGVSEEVLKVECFPRKHDVTGEELVCTRVTDMTIGRVIMCYETYRNKDK